MKQFLERLKRFARFFKSNGADNTIYLTILIISIFGIIMIGDVSIGGSATFGSYYAIINMAKQIVFVILGMGAMFFIAKAYKKRFITANLLIFGYVATLFLMLLCRLWEINGAHAWIKLGPFTLQPVEAMKVVLIVVLAYCFGQLPLRYAHAHYNTKSEKSMVDTNRFMNTIFIPFVAIGIAFFVSALWQDDLGSALIIGFISYLMLLAAPSRSFTRTKGIITCGLIVFVLAFALLGGRLLPHQMERFVTWFNPLHDPYGTSYQTVNGLIAFSNGGFFGLGFGNSVMKFGYIPEAQNDFIIAIIVEELGLFGFLIFTAVYLFFISRLFSYAFKVNDTEEKLILLGISFYFFAHYFVNVGGVSGFIPMTGVPLLLISAGGTSTLTALSCVGLAQGIIAKYNRSQIQEKVEEDL
ncbi:MAG: FtsW/RodA/SpoVE family cell cycle protein [Erysipelotrichaceae bacterium]|nr:FtsW/RodA/SpoVE family cell cycle protein [Erysipelotrichaceae bacterium]